MKKLMFFAVVSALLAGCADDRASRGIVYTTPSGSGVLSSGVDAQMGQGATGNDSTTLDNRRRGTDSGTGVGAGPDTGSGTGIGTGARTGTRTGGTGTGGTGTSSGGLGGGR